MIYWAREHAKRNNCPEHAEKATNEERSRKWGALSWLAVENTFGAKQDLKQGIPGKREGNRQSHKQSAAYDEEYAQLRCFVLDDQIRG